MTQRPNDEWITALTGADSDAALADLRVILVRGLGNALLRGGNVTEADLEDFAQDALLKILNGLDSFRGESRFTTWAQKIAVRVAYTELRRKRWQDWSLERVIEGEDSESRSDYTPILLADSAPGPETQAVRGTLVEVVQKAIAERLTERQRIAMMAVMVEGVPMEEVAVRMGSNRNALYKLLHDARSRLKKELLASGYSSEEILASFD
jgi:RNA polymerase sigma-70 factor (ECF subfamily)